MIVEQVNGRLKGKWHILDSRMECHSERVQQVVSACVALHNIELTIGSRDRLGTPPERYRWWLEGPAATLRLTGPEHLALLLSGPAWRVSGSGVARSSGSGGTWLRWLRGGFLFNLSWRGVVIKCGTESIVIVGVVGGRRGGDLVNPRTGEALSGCSATWQPLLPGLPDDVAELCLIRLPRAFLQQCRQVNRAWKEFLDSPRCLRLRTAANRLEPWLFVRAVGQPRKHFEWHAFAESAGWQKIPYPRGTGQWEASGVGCVGLDRCLYMIGGTGSDRKNPLGDTFRYDPRTARWTQLANLITPRRFFGSWATQGKIIVAGGNASELEEIQSAEMYQPETDTWQSIPPLPLAFSSFGVACFGGTLFLTEGWQWPFHFSPRGFSCPLYKLVQEKEREGLTGPRRHGGALIGRGPGEGEGRGGEGGGGGGGEASSAGENIGPEGLGEGQGGAERQGVRQGVGQGMGQGVGRSGISAVWEPMPEGMAEGWTGVCAVVHETLVTLVQEGNTRRVRAWAGGDAIAVLPAAVEADFWVDSKVSPCWVLACDVCCWVRAWGGGDAIVQVMARLSLSWADFEVKSGLFSYCPDTDKWQLVIGPPLPLFLRTPLRMAADGNNRLFVSPPSISIANRIPRPRSTAHSASLATIVKKPHRHHSIMGATEAAIQQTVAVSATASEPWEDAMRAELAAWFQIPDWVDETPSMTVSVGSNALCQLDGVATVGLPPDAVFSIVCDPHNSRVFKNIKSVKNERVISDNNGVKELEMDMVFAFQLPFFTGTFDAHMRMVHDRPNRKMSFELTRPGLMRKFEGFWQVEPLVVPASATSASAASAASATSATSSISATSSASADSDTASAPSSPLSDAFHPASDWDSSSACSSPERDVAADSAADLAAKTTKTSATTSSDGARVASRLVLHQVVQPSVAPPDLFKRCIHIVLQMATKDVLKVFQREAAAIRNSKGQEQEMQGGENKKKQGADVKAAAAAGAMAGAVAGAVAGAAAGVAVAKNAESIWLASRVYKLVKGKA
ncbi:unnamed protein product [Closterium sp. NIES-65]|nr:unnamed protein product [Closterium sp. NIES-65]